MVMVEDENGRFVREDITDDRTIGDMMRRTSMARNYREMMGGPDR